MRKIMVDASLCEKKLSAIGSFLVAYYICIPLLNQIIYVVFPSVLIMSQMYQFGVMALIIVSVLQNVMKRRSIKIRGGAALFLVYVIMFCGASLMICKSTASLNTFMCYVLLPMIAGYSIKLSANFLIKTILTISTLSAPFSSVYLVVDSNNYITMGMSYIYMTPIIAAIIYVTAVYKDDGNKRVLFLLASLAQSYFLLKIIMYGSRGPLISVILTVMFCTIVKWDRTNMRVTIRRSKSIFWLLAILLVVVNMETILRFLASLLSAKSISSQFIEKSLRLLEQNYVMNGRDTLISVAWRGIINRPILGHGMSSFESYTGYNYPHNFVVQFLYDGGMILSGFILILLYKGVALVHKYNQPSHFVLFALLLLVSVPGAFFSGDIWENERFWLFIGFLLSTCQSSFKAYEKNNSR